MKKEIKKNKMTYEPEADVFTLEITGRPIDHAKEIGNVVVHFTKDDTPVLIEILEASKFLKKVGGVLNTGLKKPVLAPR